MRKKNLGITTKHLKAILDENYTRGVNGKDYGPIKEELEQELFKRQHKLAEKKENELMEFADHWEGPKGIKDDENNLPF